MSESAIILENVSKRYRYAGTTPLSYNLRADITEWIKGFFRRGQPTHATLHEVQEKHRTESSEYFWALKDINLEIRQGEVVGIIGRNGAGKSTLLKILSRITPPTTGAITYHGRVASLLEVGTGFHRELTGRENIFLNGSILGMKRAEITKRFDEIVAFAEIDKFIDTPVKFYSSGMYVRLAFAVAAHLEPDILVVDEVLAVGDVAFQRKCLGKMGEVAKQGRTILLVTHNMVYVTHACQRAVLLENGALVADAESNSVVKRYLAASRELSGNRGLKFDTTRQLTAPGLVVPMVELLDENGATLDQIHGGETLRVRIHYQCKRLLLSPSFAVTLSTPTGVEVLRLSTLPISGCVLPDLDGEGYLDCVIERLPLTGGQYFLGVGVGRPNVEYLVFNDNVASFEIVPFDAYGSGFGVDSRCGYVVVRHRWEFVPGGRSGLSRAGSER